MQFTDGVTHIMSILTFEILCNITYYVNVYFQEKRSSNINNCKTTLFN